jgi:hypothetical protein
MLPQRHRTLIFNLSKTLRDNESVEDFTTTVIEPVIASLLSVCNEAKSNWIYERDHLTTFVVEVIY